MEERAPYSLLLVRHGEAEHHLKPITGGWTDSALTPLGLRQCQLLAERLLHNLSSPPHHVVSSDLQRARQTAHILGRAFNLDSEVHVGLKDLNNGIAAGLTHAEARRVANEPSDPLLDWQPYPDAESWRQFYTRVADFMEDFTLTQRGPALVITHSAVIHVIVAWWLGLGVESRTHFHIAPASLTVLNTNLWGEHMLERLNDTAHLYAAGIDDPITLK